ncbi:MAG: hypothetical protein ACOZDY_13270 [Pseudomonadota bacterium]
MCPSTPLLSLFGCGTPRFFLRRQLGRVASAPLAVIHDTRCRQAVFVQRSERNVKVSGFVKRPDEQLLAKRRIQAAKSVEKIWDSCGATRPTFTAVLAADKELDQAGELNGRDGDRTANKVINKDAHGR